MERAVNDVPSLTASFAIAMIGLEKLAIAWADCLETLVVSVHFVRLLKLSYLS
jgi:hypothetical protein